MKLHRQLQLVLAILCATALEAHAQQHVVLRGGAGAGRVEILDAQGQAASVVVPGLTGISLLGIDFAGRAEILRLMPDRPRLLRDVPGGRLRLQQDRGSLFHYRRALPTGGFVFGYLLVEPQGSARSLLELPGQGPGATTNPFVDRVAIAPDGGALLAASTSSAGGNLYEVDVVTGTAVDRTSTLGPQQFASSGLALQSKWGFAAASTGIVRFPRLAGVSARFVPFPGGAPAHFPGDIAVSSNGLHAMTVAGADPANEHVWAFDLTGPAVCVSAATARVSPAGYAPESPDGPYLAISDDGSRCAWRTEVLIPKASQECFVGDVAGIAPNLWATKDMNYVDTLDGIGQYIFGAASELFAAVGEATPLGVENIDVYGVRLLPSGAQQLRNVSLTSGATQTPFQPARIKPEGMTWIPQAGAWLLADNEQDRLVAIRPFQAGVTTIDADVKALDWIEAAGSDLVLALRRESGSKDRFVGRMSALLTSAPVSLYAAPMADRFTRFAYDSGTGRFAFVEEQAVDEFLVLHDPATTTKRLTNRAFPWGPALGFAQGRLGASIQVGAGPALFVGWNPPAPPFRLKAKGEPGVLLPAL